MRAISTRRSVTGAAVPYTWYPCSENWGAPSSANVSTDQSLEFWSSVDHGVTWAKRATVLRHVDRPFTIVAPPNESRTAKQFTVGNVNNLIVYANGETDSDAGPGVVMDHTFVQTRPANPLILGDGTLLVAAEELAPKWKGRVRPDAARQIWTFSSRDGQTFTAGPKVNTEWSHPSLEEQRQAQRHVLSTPGRKPAGPRLRQPRLLRLGRRTS